MVRSIGSKLHHLAFVFIIFKINIHFTRTSAQSGWAPHKTLYSMRHTFGRIIVIVVHIHYDITARPFMHNVSLLPKRHLLVILKIFHVRVRLHHILDRVAPIIDNNPLHFIFRIILAIKTLYHHLNKWAPIKCRCTHTYEGKFAIVTVTVTVIVDFAFTF